MSNIKTILLYTDESTAGGVANYNHGLLPALLAAGWRIVSAQPANDSPMLVKQRELGAEQRFISYDPCSTFSRSLTDTSDPSALSQLSTPTRSTSAIVARSPISPPNTSPFLERFPAR